MAGVLGGNLARTAYNLKSRIISQLRKLSRYAPMRGEAMRAAKVAYGKYACAHCQRVFSPSDIKVDHREPVVAPSGWVDWNTYIDRLFCPPTGLQCLCTECHHTKTQSENALRRACKAAAKGAKSGT